MRNSIELARPPRFFRLTSLMGTCWVEILPSEMRVFDQHPHQNFTPALPFLEKVPAGVEPCLKCRGGTCGFLTGWIGIRTNLRTVGHQNELKIRMTAQHLPKPGRDSNLPPFPGVKPGKQTVGHIGFPSPITPDRSEPPRFQPVGGSLDSPIPEQRLKSVCVHHLWRTKGDEGLGSSRSRGPNGSQMQIVEFPENLTASVTP